MKTIQCLVSTGDKITDGTDVYQIDSFRTHEAHQEIILYVVLGVKG